MLKLSRFARSREVNYLAYVPSWGWGWDAAVGFCRQGGGEAVISNYPEGNFSEQRLTNAMVKRGLKFQRLKSRSCQKLTVPIPNPTVPIPNAKNKHPRHLKVPLPKQYFDHLFIWHTGQNKSNS